MLLVRQPGLRRGDKIENVSDANAVLLKALTFDRYAGSWRPIDGDYPFHRAVEQACVSIKICAGKFHCKHYFLASNDILIDIIKQVLAFERIAFYLPTLAPT